MTSYRSPTDFQYGGSATPSTDGLIRLARGWFDSAGNLVRAASAPTRPRSPTTYQYRPPSLPARRSPTDFQYTNPVTSPRTTTTVDTDGATRLFGDLKDAAKETLLGSLDDALDRARGRGGSSTPSPTPVSAGGGREIAGIPIGAVIAVGVVGGLIYMKFG